MLHSAQISVTYTNDCETTTFTASAIEDVNLAAGEADSTALRAVAGLISDSVSTAKGVPSYCASARKYLLKTGSAKLQT